jgi:plastocyanin
MDRHRHLALGAALVAVLAIVAACGGGAEDPPSPSTAPGSVAPAATATPGGDAAAVTIAGFAFDPASITVAAGTTVTWTNTDSAAHTVRWDDGTAPSGSLTSGGAPYTRTFDTPGTFAYACGIHPSMTGTVVVAP